MKERKIEKSKGSVGERDRESLKEREEEIDTDIQ